MTVVHSVEGLVATVTQVTATTNAALDADPGFFEMSPASAEQVTIQIRTMLERSWEYIAIAYQGRAHLALGYRTWDEYVDARLSDLRLTVPREERAQAVAALSNARMSLRAIAKVLGVGLGTVHRDLSSRDSDDGTEVEEPGPIAIQGRDGKQYQQRRRSPLSACPICGEVHADGPDHCPWDLFAQGIGPRPDSAAPVATGQDAIPRGPQEAGEEVAGEDGGLDVVPTHHSVVEIVTRAVCIVDELAVLPDLVDEIEMTGRPSTLTGPDRGLADGVRELIAHLRVQAEVFAGLVDRLERMIGNSDPA